MNRVVKILMQREDIISSELGLEPDYIMNILFD